MDTKALARSKRAHTQHHSRKPHHPNQASSKASPEGAGGSGSAKKSLGKQPRENKPRPQALPSNWDRYDDEFDADSGQNMAGNNAGQTPDDVLPKSKGADYRHLITEALSQSQSNMYSDGFSSVDDVLHDFNQGVSSMLAVRGEGILSWIGDDSFIVDDRATTSHEASFLSLNLHALAEQLEEIELSKRLFIEADLLPPELCTDGSKTSSSKVSDKLQVPFQSKLPEGEPTGLALQNFPEETKITNESNRVTSSDHGSEFPDIVLSDRGAHHDLKQLGKSSHREAMESVGSKANSIIDEKASISKFKAATAEAELDMLLDSFGQIDSLDSSASGSTKSSAISVQETSTAQLQVPDKPKTASITANIDDFLDDLLEETSNLANQNGLVRTQIVDLPSNVQSIPSSGTGTKSKVLDDFDSWLDTI